MYCFIVLFLLLRNIDSIDQKNWLPKFINESSFGDPFDYVSDSYLPELFNEAYDWISVSGATLANDKKSYIAFTGTRKNSAKNYTSVFTKESGILVLCETSESSSQTFNFNMKCKVLEHKSLKNNDGIFFGAVVRSVKFNDKVAFIYCDPLWYNEQSVYKEPAGKCYLSYIKDYNISEKKDFQMCSSFKKCLGGFSVDMIVRFNSLEILFGLPFSNSSLHLKGAETNGIATADRLEGTFFNFGYSVSLSNYGSAYISSPVSDEHSAFVQTWAGKKFYPQNLKTQNYGGFGTSLDLVKIVGDLSGAIIGAPYQSKQNLPNVGAVFLVCDGYSTDMVVGEDKYDYFGYAVARIGDLDGDGAEEFAVSAPSLNLDKPGKIYIYRTTPACKIHKKPMQIYQSKVHGFGVSISRGFDIDFNGSPDFFVTALNSKKPYLFKMPKKVNVTCRWINRKFDTIYIKDATFNVRMYLKSESNINFDDYFFQVALDFLNKGETRFELITTTLADGYLTLTIKALMDVIDMDLKSIPIHLAVKGTRLCKKSDNDNCFKSIAFNTEWLKCNESIILPQNTCNDPKCLSDLKLEVKPDVNGTVIYLGNTISYQRTLDVTIANIGPEESPRIYMAINIDRDFEITNVKCNNCNNVPSLSSDDKASIMVIKDNIGLYQDIKIRVDILYKPMNVTKPKSTIEFKVWGINNDLDLLNNHYKANYSIIFKPSLLFSSKKAPDTIVDSRLKPPYLEAYKSIPVHEFGTNLKYSYLIENKGPELKNLKLKFKFPYQTEDKSYILYIMDKVRLSVTEEWASVLPELSRNGKKAGSCMISPKYVNPLKVKVVETHKHTNGDPPANPKRLKRSVEQDRVVTYVDQRNDSLPNGQLSTNAQVNIGSSSDHSTKIDCNTIDSRLGTPQCLEVICHLAIVPVHSVFNFDFTAWLFTETFFNKKLSDLILVTSLESDFGDVPLGAVVDGPKMAGPFSVAQKVIFSKMVVRPDKPPPLWPIIVAVIIGIILLAIIIIIAYYCGFFKRKRLQEEQKKKQMRDNRRKNESGIVADKMPLKS